MENRHTKEELRYMQSLPLDLKIRLTEDRIKAWIDMYGENGVCVSFSGGKDSTVLLHIVRNLYPDVRAVFSNTGLEYPEIRRFAMSHDNVDVVYPEMRFKDVITQYGYPIISKEVSECIHYARRIGGGQRQNTNESNCTAKENGTQGYKTSCYGAKRAILTGVYRGSKETHRRRKDLQGEWQREARVGIATENTFEKSMFNKEKYLPIARDLPVKISHLCCSKLKKAPMKKYQKENGFVPIIGTMAEESRVRMQGWIRTGCNAWDSNEPKSQPLSFWTNQDVLQYIVENDISICSVYGDIVSVDENGVEYPPNLLTGFGKLKCTGCDRTGCVYCGFGFHNEKGETRFQRLARTHPKLYEFALGGGGWTDNPDYDPTAPEYDGEWKNWNPKQIWTPNEKGLGMKKVFDLCNEIMGKEFYRYE